MKILYYEFKMDLLRTIRYKMGFISDILIFTIFLSIFLLTDTGVSLSSKYPTDNYKALLLLGYIAWSFSVSAISSTSSQIGNELQRGTFYLKFNCKYPLQILYIGDLFSSLFIHTIIVIIYTLLAKIIFHIQIFFNLEIIIAILICMIGMYGIGLILASLSLYFKQIGAINFLVQMLLLFITDTVPSNTNILYISKILPLTLCNNVIRSIFSGSENFHSIITLLFSSIAFFFIGFFCFGFFLNKSRKKGNLLFY